MGGQVISAESANLADIFGSFCSSLSIHNFLLVVQRKAGKVLICMWLT